MDATRSPPSTAPYPTASATSPIFCPYVYRRRMALSQRYDAGAELVVAEVHGQLVFTGEELAEATPYVAMGPNAVRKPVFAGPCLAPIVGVGQ